MKIAIILNGVSRKKGYFYSSILPALASKHQVAVFETQRAGDGKQLAMQHARYFDVLLAAGGDGTLHEVVNGLMAVPQRPTLGVIPLGSGNDFAGTCGIKAEGSYLLKLLQQAPKPTDIGHVVCHDDMGNAKQEYFINVCSAGMGPSTVSKMTRLPRWLGAQGRYLGAILQTFFAHAPEEVTVQCRNFSWNGSARVVAVANGQSFGNKIFIAPDAEVDDGEFNLFIGGEVPLPQFLWYLQQIKMKRKVRAQQVYYVKASDVRLSSTKAAMLEADGELLGWLPAKVEFSGKNLQVYR
ncbi:MAG: diacylglycerol/lipid kinase family protein [Flammeovirgaceae bacterium]